VKQELVRVTQERIFLRRAAALFAGNTSLRYHVIQEHDRRILPSGTCAATRRVGYWLLRLAHQRRGATEDFEYSEVFYNRLRRPFTLCYYSPAECEARTAVS